MNLATAIPRRFLLPLAATVLLCCGSTHAAPPPDLVGRGCAEPRALPLAAHWTTPYRKNPNSTTPAWQLAQIRNGHHWLLTFKWVAPDFPWDSITKRYYTDAMLEAKRLGVPISFTSPQWEAQLYDDPRWKRLRGAASPLFVEPGKAPRDAVSPFGALGPWRQVGLTWTSSRLIQELQRLYPNPPQVLLLSNNEPKDLQVKDVHRSARFRERHAARRSLDAKLEAMGDGYIERYRALLAGVRGGLTSWRDRAVLLGWGGNNPWFGGRMSLSSQSSWRTGHIPLFGFTTPGRLSIVPHIWEGASARYAINHARGESDAYAFGPPGSIMSFPLHEEHACSVNPNFLWELSIWMDPRFVEEHDVSPDRYLGMTRWGMWVSRPSVVRQFDSAPKTLADFGPFLRKVMAAVDEVHATPELTSFWRKSELVPAPVAKTPFEQDIPPSFRSKPRWFALPTNLDPPRPWGLRSEFPVWALARVQGEDGARRWLLLAQSPTKRTQPVEVDVPGWGKARVEAGHEGRFYLLEEGSTTVTPVQP